MIPCKSGSIEEKRFEIPVGHGESPLSNPYEERNWEVWGGLDGGIENNRRDGGLIVLGLFFEADEVGRCLRDGKLESKGIGWEESIVVMEVMDEIRRQNGIEYPAEIESLEFPLQL